MRNYFPLKTIPRVNILNTQSAIANNLRRETNLKMKNWFKDMKRHITRTYYK